MNKYLTSCHSTRTKYLCKVSKEHYYMGSFQPVKNSFIRYMPMYYFRCFISNGPVRTFDSIMWCQLYLFLSADSSGIYISNIDSLDGRWVLSPCSLSLIERFFDVLIKTVVDRKVTGAGRRADWAHCSKMKPSCSENENVNIAKMFIKWTF